MNLPSPLNLLPPETMVSVGYVRDLLAEAAENQEPCSQLGRLIPLWRRECTRNLCLATNGETTDLEVGDRREGHKPSDGLREAG